jgi:putative transposase
MKLLQAFKFRLEPTLQQCDVMERTAGVVRFVWNSALALQKHRLQRHAGILNYGALCKELTAARSDPELAFLNEVHSQAQQQVLKNLGRSFSDFFSGCKGFPCFKKKGRHDSFRQPQGVSVTGRHVKVPGIGIVRFRKSREIEGHIKNVTISKREGKWFVSLQTEREVEDPVHSSFSEIGIDVGVAKFAALSNCEDVHPINSFRRLEKLLTLEQQSLSRKTKFSSNWKKQKARVARVHLRIADARNDFLHKTSTPISKKHAVVYLEDLRIKNMSASARGNKEEHGKNVRAKAGLNKAILDQGWYEFRRQLDYKLRWRGGRVVLVPAQHTSQKCASCGHISPENRCSQALFICVACEHTANADTNAAKNILRAGQALSACESNSIGSRKQEPGRNRKVRPLVAAAA